MSSQRQTLGEYLQKHQAKKFFKQAKKCPVPKLCFGKTIPEQVQKKKKNVNSLMKEILAKVRRNVPDAKKYAEIEQMFIISFQYINNQFDSIFHHMNTQCPIFLQKMKSNSKTDSYQDNLSQISSNGLTSPIKTKVLTEKSLNKKLEFQKCQGQFGSFLQVPSVQIKNPLVTARKYHLKQNTHAFYSHNVSVNSELQNQQNQQGIISHKQRDVMNEGFSQQTSKSHLQKHKTQKEKTRKSKLETTRSNNKLSVFDQF